jgi:hypothetical protein
MEEKGMQKYHPPQESFCGYVEKVYQVTNKVSEVKLEGLK